MSDSPVDERGIPVNRPRIPFAELLKIQPVEFRPGFVKIQLLVEERHLRTLGIVHGGVAATMLDMALGIAAGSMAPKGFDVVTVQLNINYVRPAWLGETIIASGEIQHAGSQTAVSRGEIRTEAGVLVATGTGTFFFLKRPDQPGATFEKYADEMKKK